MDLPHPAQIAWRAAADRPSTLSASPRSRAGAARAALEPGGLRILLGRPLPVQGRLEVERAEVWSTIAEVPAGVEEVFLVCAVEGGAPLRVVSPDGSASLVCHLTDLSRVLRRRISYQGRVRVTAETLFEEPRLADGFLSGLCCVAPTRAG